MTGAIVTRAEAERLAALESTIQRGLQTFVDVGMALREIRDGRLYRATHDTFEDYCQGRWGWARAHAYRMIDAASATENVSHGRQIAGPTSERQARPLARLEPEQQREAWREAIETAPEGRVTGAHVERVVERYRDTGQREKATHQLISQSQTNEWYTPPEYVESARAVMGGIDLDPASNDTAQEWIEATIHYTEDDDGLSHTWRGRVWMNPPWGRLAGEFVTKLMTEYRAGNVTEFVTLVNAHSTDAAWFQPLWDGLLCFTDHRIDYRGLTDKPSGSTHGSVFVYFGPNEAAFLVAFEQWGAVVGRVVSDDNP